MSNEEQNNKMVLISVSFDCDKNVYTVDLAKGSNVAETAFAISVIIKCLLRDGMLKSEKDFTDLILKYLSDPQYNEVSDENK